MFKNGDKIGQQYQIVKCIGAGSFGTIYLGKYIEIRDFTFLKYISRASCIEEICRH